MKYTETSPAYESTNQDNFSEQKPEFLYIGHRQVRSSYKKKRRKSDLDHKNERHKATIEPINAS